MHVSYLIVVPLFPCFSPVKSKSSVEPRSVGDEVASEMVASNQKLYLCTISQFFPDGEIACFILEEGQTEDECHKARTRVA